MKYRTLWDGVSVALILRFYPERVEAKEAMAFQGMIRSSAPAEAALMSANGTKRTCSSRPSMSASLIGRQGQALSDYPPLQCRCRSRARASLRNRHQGPFHHGIRGRGGTIY